MQSLKTFRPTLQILEYIMSAYFPKISNCTIIKNRPLTCTIDSRLSCRPDRSIQLITFFSQILSCNFVSRKLVSYISKNSIVFHLLVRWRPSGNVTLYFLLYFAYCDVITSLLNMVGARISPAITRQSLDSGVTVS